MLDEKINAWVAAKKFKKYTLGIIVTLLVLVSLDTLIRVVLSYIQNRLTFGHFEFGHNVIDNRIFYARGLRHIVLFQWLSITLFFRCSYLICSWTSMC